MNKYSTLKIVATYLLVSIFVSLLLLLIVYPIHPTTMTGTFVWYLASVPVWVVMEGVGNVIFNETIGKKINKDTNNISVGRIGYGVIATLLSFVIMYVIVISVNNSLHSFLENNYSNKW